MTTALLTPGGKLIEREVNVGAASGRGSYSSRQTAPDFVEDLDEAEPLR
jgi:hypothetical protein